MKKLILSLLFVLIAFSQLLAETRYWVGGSGSWNDSRHWSQASGGAGGYSIPGPGDDVVFDGYSFSARSQTVEILSDAHCRNLVFTTDSLYPLITGPASSRLFVNGSLAISIDVENRFAGQFHFTSGTRGTLINTGGKLFAGDVYFDNPRGSWVLANSLLLKKDKSVYLQAGALVTDNHRIHAGSIASTGSGSFRADLGRSVLFLVKDAEFVNSSNISVKRSSYTVQRTSTESTPTPEANCGPGSQQANGSQGLGEYCVSIPNCNAAIEGIHNNGCIVVDNVNGLTSFPGVTGPFTFEWSGGNIAGTVSGSNICGLIGSTYLVTITDQSTGDIYQEFVVLPSRDPLGIVFQKTIPTCFGDCDGLIRANAIGGSAFKAGSAPYTYLWNNGQTGQTNINLCASPAINSVSVTITDSLSCTRTFTTNLLQPKPIQPNVTSANITCFGLCNGRAFSTPTGGAGTAPPAIAIAPGGYDFVWSPGGNTNDTILNLCPGSYTLTVTDDSLCSASATIVIIEPPELTISPSDQDVTCNGFNNGIASLQPVAGGTPNYTFTWTPNVSSADSVGGLSPGTYSVVVSDANGCRDSAAFVITEPAPLVANLTDTDILCFGQCTGRVSSTPTGGTAPYEFSWSNGQNVTGNTSTLNNLCAGTYSVSIRDAMNCIVTATVVVSEPPDLVVAVTSQDISCFGQCDGTASVGIGGGVPNYNIQWSNGASSNSISNLCAGTFEVIVTDANNCRDSAEVTIIQPPQLTATTTKTDVLCNGGCNGSASVIPAGGSGPYTFLWMPGNTTNQAATGLCAGTYTVTVTDDNGCVVIRTVTITQPNALNVSITASSLACNGVCNASACGNITGGVAPYRYSWNTSPTQTTSCISNLCAGTYSLTVTDNNNCVTSASTVINQPTALSVSTSATDASCNGRCDGTVGALAGGGTPPYNYTWSPGTLPGANLTNRCAGTYTVTVTDNNGCSGSGTATVSQPQILSPNIQATNVSCNGLNNGSVTVTPTGGTAPYTYDWAPGNPTGEGTPTISGLSPGTYSVNIRDNQGCVVTASVAVTQPQPLAASVVTAQSSCNVCNGSTRIAPTGGTRPYTYTWANTTSTDSIASGLCPGTYSVTVTDARGCSTTLSSTINQTVQILITISDSSVSCFGACDGIATANASGGRPQYSYLWSTAAGTTLSTTQTASGLCAGTYVVLATDADGCFNRDTVTFVNPVAVTTTVTSTNLSCNGTCDGTASATGAGGTGTFTYLWRPGNLNTQSISGLCAGTYTVTVRDGNNCAQIDSVTITQSDPLSVTYTTVSANCGQADGSITITPAGGVGNYTYSWSAAGATTQNLANITAGIYTVTITDAAGCALTTTVPVSNINGPTVTISSTNVPCFGDCSGTSTINITPAGPAYTIDWAGTPSGDGTTSVTGLCAGVQNVAVTDAVGCVRVATDTIVAPPALSVTSNINNVSCNGGSNGSISVNASGGVGNYSYQWSPGGQITSNISNLPAGTYTLTLRDGNNCDSVLTFTLTEPPALAISMSSTDVVCNSDCDGTASAVVTGGTLPYTYSWNNGGVVPEIVNLCPATYTLTVTDARGCNIIATATITEPDPLVASISSSNATCFASCNGSATASATGGTGAYAFIWSPGAINTATASALCAGSYTVTVTDDNSCATTGTVSITEPQQVTPGVVVTNVTCNGACNGRATANATGGTGAFTYSWSPGGETTSSISNLCPGTYTVVVSDANNCSGTQIITITEPAVLVPNASGIDPVCSGDCNGMAVASAIGGTAPYSYLWTQGSVSNDTLANLCDGTYQVTVTDANLCSAGQTVTLIDPPALDVLVSEGPPNCGVSNGSISLTPITGTAPYNYSWSPAVVPPGPGSNSASNLAAGIYLVTVTDASGCDSTFVITLNNNDGPTDDSNITVNTTCPGGCDGTSTVFPVGGTLPYLYEWFDDAGTAIGQTSQTATALCAGAYIIEVTDGNSCIYFANDTVGQPDPIVANADITPNTCTGISDGAITVNPSGGTGPYTLEWQPGGSNSSTITGLAPGTYTLTITDDASCVMVDSFVVAPASVLDAVVSTSSINCSDVCSGIATVDVLSGNAPFNFQWSDPLAQTNDTAMALCAGVYFVTITDALGCNLTVSGSITATPPVIANPAVTMAACGVCDGAISVAPTGGTAPFDYLWAAGDTTSSVSGLCAGVYYVNITDSNGCSAFFRIPVTNDNALVLSKTVNDVSCFGANDGSASVSITSGNAPFTFAWVPGGQSSNSVSGLEAGTYFIQVSDSAGCSAIDSVVIESPPQILDNRSVNNPACGLSNGSITVSPAGGTGALSWTWSPAVAANNATTATNLAADIYTVTITDANGCSEDVIIPLSNPGGPEISVSSADIACSAVCTGTADVDAAGSQPFTYKWSNGAITDSISNLCAGTYIVQVTDNAGCVSSGQVTISEPQQLATSLTFTTEVGCADACNGTATIIPSGGVLPYTFYWNPGGYSGITTTGLCAGIYLVTVTDANGCMIAVNAEINNSAVPLIQPNPVITDATCDACNGAAVLAPSGGAAPYSYIWSYGDTTSAVTGLCAGVYYVSVTDSNGCSASFQVPVNNTSGPEITASVTNATCFGSADGAASVSVTGGTGPYTYMWIPGGHSAGSVTGLTAGTYLVQVKDANGCSTVDSVVVSSPSRIEENRSVNNAQCGVSNGSITISPTGGTGALTWTWSPAVAVPNTATANNLAAGIYTVTITDGAGCSRTVAIPVSNPGGPALTLTSANISCNGSCNGTADVDATGNQPFAFQWSNGQVTDAITGLCEGTYVVQVTDNAGCVSSAQVVITQPPVLAFSMPFTIDALCNGDCNGVGAVIPSGGTLPYTFSWSPVTSSSPSDTTLCAGNYDVTVADAGGCSVVQQVTINEPAPLAISGNVTPASCNTVNDGAIDITVTGGVTPYSYEWTGGTTAATEDLTNIFMGTYIVLVTDSNLCQLSDTFLVEPLITVTAAAGNDTIFCEGGTTTLSAVGSTNALTYLWFEASTNTLVGDSVVSTANPPVGSTSYYVVAFNGACSDTDTVVVTSVPLPAVDAGPDFTILMFNNGTVGGNPTGPPGVTYSWSPGTLLSDSTLSNPVATPTVTTTYTVMVTNSIGCSAIDSVKVTVLPQIIFPNGISPNGDGANDVWIIDNIEQFPNCIVEVYNRWGEMLFQSVGYKEKWDGRYKGQDLPVGTYYYIINLNDPLYPDVYTGPITILR